jgi:hypothetical protein
MSEAQAAPATPATPPAAPAINEAAALAMMGMGPAPEPAAKAAETKTSPSKAAPSAEDDDATDPLDESLYSDEALATPEQLKAARARLFKHLGKVNELTRKSHRAHGAAEVREKKLERREESIKERETRVSAMERLQNQAIEDFESGDTTRFLTSVAKLSKTGDPVGFWRNCSIALAKGEAFKPAEKAAIAADPELKARLEGLERVVQERNAREENEQIERLKTQHFETAKSSADKFPLVAAFCAEKPERAREGIAAVMHEEFLRIGRAVDISTACGIIEAALSERYELSQRAGGKTNGEKGTTGSEPDAGRETSKEPPKPETAIAPATVPAALASHPGSATRAESAEERRQREIREFEALGFFG